MSCGYGHTNKDADTEAWIESQENQKESLVSENENQIITYTD